MRGEVGVTVTRSVSGNGDKGWIRKGFRRYSEQDLETGCKHEGV